MSDPYYRAIEDALERRDFDPGRFEEAVRVLLSDVLPLAAVPGGQDQGMDGAIFDGQGTAFPLVVTKSKDVAGLRRNLKESLASYQSAGNRRRRAILATPLLLRQASRQGLEELAREQNFELAQIYQREDLTKRFYSNPHLARDVLGVSPKPSALSSIPRSQKPFPNAKRVGRAEDLAWLRQGEDRDRLLIGEPGSGKTFLLRRYAEQGNGVWFLTEKSDREQISHALLEHRPRVVVIDDAHDALDTIEALRHRRAQLTRLDHFSILAVTQKDTQVEVRQALGLSEASIHQLPLMTRQEIVAVYHALGVADSDERLRELVTQAAHKPGLAETLAVLWHEGAWEDIFTGRGLKDAIAPLLRRWVGEHATTTLAAFALGGESGMALSEAARGLGRPKPEVVSEVSKLKALGFLVPRGERLAVIPLRLGHVLIAGVFFSEATSLPWEDFVSPDDSSYRKITLLEALVAAAHTQTEGRWGDLKKYLQEWGQPVEWDPRLDLWASFAALHSSYARWTLETYPGDRFKLAGKILWSEPQTALNLLLADDAGQDLREILGPWIRDVHASRRELRQRRQRLIQQAQSALRRRPAAAPALAAMTVALDPNLEGSSTDPGAGRTVTLKTGLPASAMLAEIFDIWPEVLRELKRLEDWTPEVWRAVRHGFDAWLYPVYRELTSETEEVLRKYALKMMNDLAALTRGHLGIQSNLKRRASSHDLDLETSTDPLFEFLYSDDYLSEGSPEHDAARNRAHVVAADWSRDTPLGLARQLESYQNQVAFLDYEPHPQNLRFALEELAVQVDDLEPWLRTLASTRVHPWSIVPMVESLHEPLGTETRELLFSLLSFPTTKGPAAARLLRSESLSNDELDRLLPQLNEISHYVYGMAYRNELPPATLARVLRSTEGDLALEAALGLWRWDSPIPLNLRGDWEEVVVTKNAPLQLRSLLYPELQKAPDLAYQWLRRRAEDCGAWQEIPAARLSLIRVLDPAQRETLIDLLAAHPSPDQAALQALVGDDLDLYARLLDHPDAKNFAKAAPFGGRIPDDTWHEMVQLATDAGVLPDELAYNMIHEAERAVDIETHYTEWIRTLEPLLEDPNVAVRDVVQAAQKMALSWQKKLSA